MIITKRGTGITSRYPLIISEKIRVKFDGILK